MVFQFYQNISKQLQSQSKPPDNQHKCTTTFFYLVTEESISVQVAGTKCLVLFTIVFFLKLLYTNLIQISMNNIFLRPNAYKAF
ncbi:hypothetical protein FKM82_019354 [Ascaphus truei]